MPAPTFFTATDLTVARDAALGHAGPQARAWTEASTALAALREVCASRPSLTWAARLDETPTSVLRQIRPLVLSGALTGYGYRKPKVLSGVPTVVCGLTSDAGVYTDLVGRGVPSRQASVWARLGRGSVETAEQVPEFYESRLRVMRLLEAVAAHDWRSSMSACSHLTPSDVEGLRTALAQARCGEYLIYSRADLAPLLAHRDFAEATLSAYRLRSPLGAVRALTVGLLVAAQGGQ